MYSNVESTHLPWEYISFWKHDYFPVVYSGRLSNVLGSTCCLRMLYLTVRILVNVLDFCTYLIYRGDRKRRDWGEDLDLS